MTRLQHHLDGAAWALLEPTLTDADAAALVASKGGITAQHDTDAGRRYERLSALGYVKEVSLIEKGVAWKLTMEGHAIAYADKG